MANSEVDIGQLSESQQMVLEQYTVVTNQEPESAIPLLRRSQWNLQVCRYGTSLVFGFAKGSNRLQSQSSSMVNSLIPLRKL